MKRTITPPLVEPVPFTQEGYEQIQEEEKQLLIERVDAIGHLQKSRELGDLKENGYYQASRQKVNAIDARLRRLKFLIRYGVIREASQSEVVEIGSTVTIKTGENGSTYQIVGGEESNPSEGKISHKSPLGKALIGKKVGEKAIISVPIGEITYTLQKIS